MGKTIRERRRSGERRRHAALPPSAAHTFANVEFAARLNARLRPIVAREPMNMADRRRAWGDAGLAPLRFAQLTDAMVFAHTGLFGVPHLVYDFQRTRLRLRGWFPDVRTGDAPADATARVGRLRFGEDADGGVLEFFAALAYVHLPAATLDFFVNTFQVDPTTVSHTLRACLKLVARGWAPLYYSAHSVDWDRCVVASMSAVQRLLPYLGEPERTLIASGRMRAAVLAVDGYEVHEGEPQPLELHHALGSPKNDYHVYGIKLLLIVDAALRPLYVTTHVHGARAEECALFTCPTCGVASFLLSDLPPDVILLCLQDRGVRIEQGDFGAVAAPRVTMMTPAFVQSGPVRRDRFTQREIAGSRAVSSVRVAVERAVHLMRCAGHLARFVPPDTVDMCSEAVCVATAICRVQFCEDEAVQAFRLRAGLGHVIKLR